MRLKRSLLSLLAILTLATPVQATHSLHACELFVLGPPIVTVKLCRWPGTPEYDKDKVVAILRAWYVGAKPTEPITVTVTLVEGMLEEHTAGIYEPASKAIFIETGPVLSIRFYYALAHELVHALWDQRHVPWDQQHCLMYTTDPILNPVRALLREWAPGVVMEDPRRIRHACS